jgi:hypothetical protein
MRTLGTKSQSAIHVAIEFSVATILAMQVNFAFAQTEPLDCDMEGKNCVGPTSATPEVNAAPDTTTRGTLPKGRAPISDEVLAKLERRNALREMQPEAAYKLSVEIGRHFGLALDGKESYEELDRMLMEEKALREREVREQATVTSAYVNCTVPGTASIVQEGTTTCLSSFSPALCPSCREGWQHRCERAGTGIDAAGVWRPLEECVASPKASAPDSQEAQIRGPSSVAVTTPTAAQSDCDVLLEGIAALGADANLENADAKYSQMESICGDMDSCMQRIQQCSNE